MNDKRWHEKPYLKIIHKLFFRTLFLIFLAIAAVLFIRSAAQGIVGNLITEIYCRLFHLEWEQGASLYRFTIRRHFDLILIGAIIVSFLIFFRLSLSWFVKYFDEIIAGVNLLVSQEERKIVLSPELDFMAQKLTQVQKELIRSREKDRESEKQKNDLVIYLAHDIKTPLTSVIGYLSLIDELPDMPFDQRTKYVQTALAKANRLEKLMNELFEITRYNLHSVPLNKDYINLNYMMIQIVDESYPLLSASNQTVTTGIPEHLQLYGDSEKLARVFNNILKNAITYGADGSVIHIKATAGKDTFTIQFINPGFLPQDKLDTIFEKFYRMDQSRQTATGGSGLGLAIAKDIVTLHNGTISATCEDHHIIFTITLPSGHTS